MKRDRDHASVSANRNSSAGSMSSRAASRARIRFEALSAARRSPSVAGRANSASIFRSLAMSCGSSSNTVRLRRSAEFPYPANVRAEPRRLTIGLAPTAPALGWTAWLEPPVQRFRRDVGPVWPHHSSTVQEETAEVVDVLQGFEDWPVEPWLKVEGAFGVVVERKVNPKPAAIVSPDHGWQERHRASSLQRRNPIERSPRLHIRPVGFQFRPVQCRPFSNQPDGCA